MEALTDINGKDSSKRIWGYRYLSIGIIMPILHMSISIIMSIINKPFTYPFPFDIWLAIITLGAALLGLTIFEKSKK